MEPKDHLAEFEAVAILESLGFSFDGEKGVVENDRVGMRQIGKHPEAISELQSSVPSADGWGVERNGMGSDAGFAAQQDFWKVTKVADEPDLVTSVFSSEHFKAAGEHAGRLIHSSPDEHGCILVRHCTWDEGELRGIGGDCTERSFRERAISADREWGDGETRGDRQD